MAGDAAGESSGQDVQAGDISHLVKKKVKKESFQIFVLLKLKSFYAPTIVVWHTALLGL